MSYPTDEVFGGQIAAEILFPKRSANHRSPSGPAVMPRRPAAGDAGAKLGDDFSARAADNEAEENTAEDDCEQSRDKQ